MFIFTLKYILVIWPQNNENEKHLVFFLHTINVQSKTETN
jgi:hypothetical protein